MVYKFHTSALRSSIMQKIKSNKTKPEIAFRKALRKEKIRYRSYKNSLPGKPDVVLLEKKVVIFIDGEFWHGYKWKEKRKRIKAHRNYWIPKIERTIKRDKDNSLKLKELGWKVLRFWEHQIRKDMKKCITKVKSA
jgi:DNA mismatch endonuclease (patch repair protein)